MESAGWSAQGWAEQGFGDADLGDARLTKRAVGIAARLACVPGGTLPDPIPEWSQLKAAYRFLHNPRVNFHACFCFKNLKFTGIVQAAGKRVGESNWHMLD